MHGGLAPGLWPQTRALPIAPSQRDSQLGRQARPLPAFFFILKKKKCLIIVARTQLKSRRTRRLAAAYFRLRRQMKKTIDGRRVAGERLGGKADVLAPELLHGFNLLATNRYNWIR